MIDLRSFEVPTVVKHAPGAITELAEQVKALGRSRPMLVTDQGLVAAGLVAEATSVLRAAGVDYVLSDGVVPNPGITLVDDAARLYREEGCDSLIGLGGGSPMDTAKSVGVVAGA
jgi:choline dehydrogenase